MNKEDIFEYQLTLARLDGDDVLDVEQCVVVLYGEHVVIMRLAGQRVQLRVVCAVADADGEQVDALSVRLGRLHLRDLRVVRLAVSDDDGDVRDVGPSAVLGREHHRPHVAQGRRSVRVTADVGDVPVEDRG